MKKKKNIIIPADPGDSEDFDVTEAALRAAQAARKLRMLRSKLKLTQKEFADKFHVPVGTLRDWEQARVKMPDFAIAYIQLIEARPKLVAKIVA